MSKDQECVTMNPPEDTAMLAEHQLVLNTELPIKWSTVKNFVLTVGAGYNCDNGLHSTQTHTQILSLFDQTQIKGMRPRRPKVT